MAVVLGRSREGAWIETIFQILRRNVGKGRSREGAWIETRCSDVLLNHYEPVAPVRERGLKQKPL